MLQLNRLCFSEKKRRTAKPLATKTYDILPNYPIKKGRISMNSMLPAAEETSSKSLKLVVDEDVRRFADKYKLNFEMIYPSVGQLLCVFVMKQEFMQKSKRLMIDDVLLPPSVSTCSLATVDESPDSLFIISCLHSIKAPVREDSKNQSHHYDRKCYFVKSEVDVGESLWKAFEVTKAVWGRRKLDQKIAGFADDLIACLNKRFHQNSPFIRAVEPCPSFLAKRRAFIEKASKAPLVSSSSGAVSHDLLDPEFLLQPIPSVDVLAFTPSPGFVSAYSAYLRQGTFESEFSYTENTMSFSSSLQALQSRGEKGFSFLNVDSSYHRKIEEGSLATLLGYQSINLERPSEEVYRKSFSNKIKGYIDAEFMNDNLSLGFCIIKRVSDHILTFQGNTSEGSSGSPILNEALELIGFNFGCYYDNQTDQSLRIAQKKRKKQTMRSQSNRSKHPKTPRQHSAKSTSPAKLLQASLDSTGRAEAAACLYPHDPAQFDIEIDEPGKDAHLTTLKNRNLAICMNHPVIKEWVKERKLQTAKKAPSPISFKGITKDKAGNKDSVAGKFGKSKR